MHPWELYALFTLFYAVALTLNYQRRMKGIRTGLSTLRHIMDIRVTPY